MNLFERWIKNKKLILVVYLFFDMKFRLIDTGYGNPFINMAIDEALLKSKLPVIRFYRWKPSAISIGYFQNMKEEIDIIKCEELGIGYVRRITGGKAVFHDNELTYSIIIDKDLMPKTILESYKMISEGLISGLICLGLNPQMKSENIEKLNSSNCFNQPSSYELTINNKKFVGSAQKRVNNKILQHGSILIDVDIKKMCSLFMVNSDEFVRITKKKVTSINQELGKKIDCSSLIKNLRQGFSKTFKADIIDSSLTKEELKLAEYLAESKYSTHEWNFMK